MVTGPMAFAVEVTPRKAAWQAVTVVASQAAALWQPHAVVMVLQLGLWQMAPMLMQMWHVIALITEVPTVCQGASSLRVFLLAALQVPQEASLEVAWQGVVLEAVGQKEIMLEAAVLE